MLYSVRCACEFVWKGVGKDVVGIFVIVVTYLLVAIISKCKNEYNAKKKMRMMMMMMTVTNFYVHHSFIPYQFSMVNMTIGYNTVSA